MLLIIIFDFNLGSHWLSALVSLLLRNVDIDKASVPRIPLIDVFDTEMLVTKPAPREISTHLRYEYLPSEHLQNKGKVILLLRNPKDVAVSFYHFCKVEYTLRYSGSWEYFLKLFLDGSGKQDRHYENTPIQIYWTFYNQLGKFSDKKC